MRKNEEEQGTVFLRYGKNVLLGGVSALLFCLAFLLVMAFGISTGALDENLRYQLAVVACVLGSFLGGVLAVRGCGGYGLLAGMLVGAVLFLLQLTIGILTYDTFQLEGNAFGLLFGDLCGGAAAGILARKGTRKKQARSKKKRRH